MVDIQNRFARLQGVRNAYALRMSAILTIVFFAGFWVLDWYIIRDHVVFSFILRATGTSYAIFLLVAYKKSRRWVQRHHWPLTLTLGLLLSWSIAIMCWLHKGYESPYYAGINMVVLFLGMQFSWSVRQALIYNLSTYLFYTAPFFLGFIAFQDFSTALANQFFFVSVMVLTAIAQHQRVWMEKKDFLQRRALKNSLAQVQLLATKDSLTDLNNRRQTLLLGEHEYRRCERYGRPFAVIMIDIDHFKKINDSHGHGVGDEVLQQVSDVLKRSSRTSDIVGRYGGEEFLIFLPEAVSSQAHTIVAERIQSGIRRKVFETSAGPLRVTLSMGVSDNQFESQALHTLIERADASLYEAKRSGRDIIIEWSPESELPTPKLQFG